MSDLTEVSRFPVGTGPFNNKKKQKRRGEATCWFGAWCCKNIEMAADVKDVKHSDWAC